MGTRERELWCEDEDPPDGDGRQMKFWSHSNKYSLENACEVCDGLIRHESWCIIENAEVYRAFHAILYGLDEADEARLAGMGVRWGAGKKKCVK